MSAQPDPVPATEPSPAPLDDLEWWNRLGVRLWIAIALVTAATIAGLLVVVLRAQERHMIDIMVRGTDQMSDTIRSTTYYDMLEDRRSDVYRMMESIGRQPGVERVRMFNKEGKITFSTDVTETSTYVDKRAESCYACHAADRPIVRPNLTSRVRTFERDGHRVLGMVTPIYNDERCSTAGCHVHPASQRVLGVVDLSMSLAGIDAQLARLRTTTIAVGTLGIIAFALVIALVVRRSVLQPVVKLMAATRRLARGEMTYRVEVESRDELGELGRSFNDMAQSLAAARAERLRLLESLELQVEERTAQLKRAQEQLVRSEKLSSLGRLSASIAHEINNPLAGILTYAKLLIRSLDDPTGADKARVAAIRQLKLVQRETERCSAIVRNLLDFARERPLDLKDVSINQVLDDALVLVGNQARLANVRLVKAFGDVPPVHADFGQLRQAMINLLINACDAMPSGGELELTTHAADDGRTVTVAVRDSGCGIPKEQLSKVLDPFFTTKEKGTGLGLSVVYGIVERHAGTIDIASEVGVGTTVTIALPASGAADGRDLVGVGERDATRHPDVARR
jgi:two-component system NtrC family sensor kinase